MSDTYGAFRPEIGTKCHVSVRHLRRILTSTGDDLSVVQGQIDSDKAKLLAFLKAQGIDEDEMSLGRFSVTDLMAQEYRPERAETSRFILRYSVRSAPATGRRRIQRRASTPMRS